MTNLSPSRSPFGWVSPPRRSINKELKRRRSERQQMLLNALGGGFPTRLKGELLEIFLKGDEWDGESLARRFGETYRFFFVFCGCPDGPQVLWRLWMRRSCLACILAYAWHSPTMRSGDYCYPHGRTYMNFAAIDMCTYLVGCGMCLCKLMAIRDSFAALRSQEIAIHSVEDIETTDWY